MVLKEKLQDISPFLRFWLVLANRYDKIVKVLKENCKIFLRFWLVLAGFGWFWLVLANVS